MDRAKIKALNRMFSREREREKEREKERDLDMLRETEGNRESEKVGEREKRKRNENEGKTKEEKEREERRRQAIFSRSTVLRRSPEDIVKEVLEKSREMAVELIDRDREQGVEFEGINISDSEGEGEDEGDFSTPMGRKMTEGEDRFNLKNISFDSLVEGVIVKTGDVKSGKIRFNLKDMAEVHKIMYEIVVRYNKKNKELAEAKAECQLLRERCEWMNVENIRWKKNVEKLGGELEKKEREGDIAEKTWKRLEEIIGKAKPAWQSEYENGFTRGGERRETRGIAGGAKATLMSECGMTETESVSGLETENEKSKGAIKKAGTIKRKVRAMTSDTEGGESGETERWQEVRRKKRTFADIVGGTEGRRERVVREPWKTPPRTENKGAELKIQIEGLKGQELVRVARSAVVKAGVKGVRMMREVVEGKVVAVFENEEDCSRVREAIQKEEGVKLGTETGPLPRLRLSGVEKGYTDEAIIRGIYEGNNELWGGASLEECMGGAKIIYRRQCRNDYKENIVMQMKGETFKRIVKAGRVSIDLIWVFAEECLEIAVCYRCSRFGHLSKNCKDKECCYKCGGEHEGRDCRREWDCPNCRRVGVGRESRRHAANDRKCPVYVRKWEQRRNNTDY